MTALIAFMVYVLSGAMKQASAAQFQAVASRLLSLRWRNRLPATVATPVEVSPASPMVPSRYRRSSPTAASIPVSLAQQLQRGAATSAPIGFSFDRTFRRGECASEGQELMGRRPRQASRSPSSSASVSNPRVGR